MKIRMTFMMMLLLLSGLLTNAYGESYQSWSNVPGRVLTSYDFLEDPELVLHNDDLILIFLDAAENPEVSIPYENAQTLTRTICWDQEDSSHTATLVDESGDPVFTLGPGECVSPTIEEGFYTLTFHHDGTGEPATFVLQPISGEGGGAETEISPNYSQADLDRLKKTNQCPVCDLSGAVLSGTDLRGANLSGADLNGAYLNGADLRGAYLLRADLRGANLLHANLTGAYLAQANLKEAYLYGADLSGADLFHANLSGADLRGADLYEANLYEANLNGADLSGANLSGATWVNGSKCGFWSIGMCAPSTRPN